MYDVLRVCHRILSCYVLNSYTLRYTIVFIIYVCTSIIYLYIFYLQANFRMLKPKCMPRIDNVLIVSLDLVCKVYKLRLKAFCELSIQLCARCCPLHDIGLWHITLLVAFSWLLTGASGTRRLLGALVLFVILFPFFLAWCFFPAAAREKRSLSIAYRHCRQK